MEGGSQASGPIGAIATSLRQQHGIQVASATYTTTHGSTGSLTHWVRPGIEPASSWMLVRFINPWAVMGTPWSYIYIHFLSHIIFHHGLSQETGNYSLCKNVEYFTHLHVILCRGLSNLCIVPNLVHVLPKRALVLFSFNLTHSSYFFLKLFTYRFTSVLIQARAYTPIVCSLSWRK